MRIIKQKKLERVYHCPHCDSILGVTKEDIGWYTDWGGTQSPFIKCPVCQKCTDVEGCESLKGLL